MGSVRNGRSRDPLRQSFSPLAADVEVFEPRVPPGGLDVLKRVRFEPVKLLESIKATIDTRLIYSADERVIHARTKRTKLLPRH
jgi:hypothetical protein